MFLVCCFFFSFSPPTKVQLSLYRFFARGHRWNDTVEHDTGELSLKASYDASRILVFLNRRELDC